MYLWVMGYAVSQCKTFRRIDRIYDISSPIKELEWEVSDH